MIICCYFMCTEVSIFNCYVYNNTITKASGTKISRMGEKE